MAEALRNQISWQTVRRLLQGGGHTAGSKEELGALEVPAAPKRGVEAGWGQTLIAHALLNAACAGLHVCQLDICEHLLPRAILLMLRCLHRTTSELRSATLH